MQGPGNGGMPAPNLAEETDPHVQTEPRKLTPTSAGIFPTLLDVFGTRLEPSLLEEVAPATSRHILIL